MSDALSKLREVVVEGLLLHGSPRGDLPVLIPHLANDRSKREGNQKAVFATPIIPIAILCALMRPKQGVLCCRMGWSTVAGHIRAWGENVELQNGYIYVLPAETFVVVHEDNGEETKEFASPLSVEPVDIVAVTPAMLAEFNVVIDLK